MYKTKNPCLLYLLNLGNHKLTMVYINLSLIMEFVHFYHSKTMVNFQKRHLANLAHFVCLFLIAF